jgi:hypothetical protein
MKKTFEELKSLDASVAWLYAKDGTLRNSKFGYAWGKFFKKNIGPTQEELSDKITDSQVDNALVDEKTKELLKDASGNYKYGKEGMKLLLEHSRKLINEFNSKEIEVVPYFIKLENMPELSDEQREEFEGLIINKPAN